MAAESARPTLRCLREDLRLALPPVNRLMDPTEAAKLLDTDS